MDAVDVVENCSEAFARGGVEATVPFLAENLRWFPGVVRGAVAVRGRDAYLAHHADAATEGVTIGFEPTGVRDLGSGRVLSSGRVVVTSAEQIDRRPMHWMMIVEDDLITSIAAHGTEIEALASVGLATEG
ncbi:MAG: hypothetical protein WKF96_25225 [Solirubrobacteraceae bacterium]